MNLRAALLCGLAACNWVYAIDGTELRPPADAALGPDADPRSDLDRDGIKDVEDECIAPTTDALVDSDYDGTPNNEDLCPLDDRPTGDSDGDGVGDLCDPEPDVQNRRRCVIAFTDPDFDVRMWLPRGDGDGWALYYPRMLYAHGVEDSIVADWSFEANRGPTTFEIVGRLYDTNFAVLPRASRDVGGPQLDCTLLRTAAGWSLGTAGAQPVAFGPIAQASSYPYRIQVTLGGGAPGDPTMRCRAEIANSAPVTVDSTEPLPFGTLGFQATRATVTGIAVYGRADAP